MLSLQYQKFAKSSWGTSFILFFLRDMLRSVALNADCVGYIGSEWTGRASSSLLNVIGAGACSVSVKVLLKVDWCDQSKSRQGLKFLLWEALGSACCLLAISQRNLPLCPDEACNRIVALFSRVYFIFLPGPRAKKGATFHSCRIPSVVFVWEVF